MFNKCQLLLGTIGMFASAMTLTPALAEMQCFGEYPYRVCTESYTDSDGDLHVRSWDTMGNDYNLDTESYTSSNGDLSVRSYDSMGNEYSIKSWSDSSGVHSVDSMGNQCTILNDGTMIGCQ